jgi:hypothetical protein
MLETKKKLSLSKVLDTLKIEESDTNICVQGIVDGYIFYLSQDNGEDSDFLWWLQVHKINKNSSFIHQGVWQDSYNKRPLEAINEVLRYI